jgi:M6 family metalloprotease-like protein
MSANASLPRYVTRLAFATCLLAAGICVVLLAASPAFALQPPRAGEIAKMKREGTLDAALARAKALGNERVPASLVRRLQRRLGSPPFAGPLFVRPLGPLVSSTPPFGYGGAFVDNPFGLPGMPSEGTVTVPVVLIDFTDHPATLTEAQLDSLVNGPGDPANYPLESVKGFYQRSSYGKLDIQGDVLGIYHAPYARSVISTAEDSTGEEDLIDEAFTYFDQNGTDFSRYDNNGDGTIDYAIVFWAGPRGDWSTFWWGHFAGGSNGEWDGKTLGTHSWQWEPDWTDGPSVVLHETGHALGLPDLYDYDDEVGPPGGVGGWDMMDTNSCDHNAFSKMLLGWIAPTVVSSASVDVTLRPTSTAPDAAVVMPAFSLSQPFREMFVAQARRAGGNDAALWAGFPSSTRLMVWHVDALPAGGSFMWNNSYTSHKLVRLMEADGDEDIEQGWGGNTFDLFAEGQTFGPSTTPSSTTYFGTSSGVTLSGIALSGDDLTFNAAISGATCDVTPPVTTMPYPGGWVDRDVPVAFSVTDASPANTYFKQRDWDGPYLVSLWETSSDVTIDTEGETTVDFRSMDWAGNLEATRSIVVRIDRGPPVTASDAQTITVGPALIHLTATDALSGVASTRWVLDGGAPKTGTLVSVESVGAHTLEFASRDAAGNDEVTRTVTFTVRRAFDPVFGSGRLDTAAEASKRAFPASGSADTIVLCTGWNWPDALGGASLAGAYGGPLLLTKPGALSSQVLAEAGRLDAKRVVILGSERAVSAAVETALKAVTVNGHALSVTRIGGASRYETAAMIASAAVGVLESSGHTYDGTAFFATGGNFPDALAASPIAASRGWPILLVRSDAPSTFTESAITKLGVRRGIMLGSDKAVSAGVEARLKTLLRVAPDRLFGATRYDTGIAIARFGVAGGLHWDGVAIATGTNFPDALAGGVMQGRLGSVVLLTPGTSLEPAVGAELTAHKTRIAAVRYLGGTSALSQTVRDAVAAALR